jgi:hypothetical protein
MTTLLSRRLFLRRAGVATASAAAVLTPPIVVAATSAPTENPDLLAAGQELAKAEAVFLKADAAKEAAHRAFDAICPKMPDELVTGADSVLGHCCEGEVDGELNPVYPPAAVDENGKTYYPGPRRILSSQRLRDTVAHEAPRSRYVREAKKMLPVAERYEAEFEAARQTAGLPSATEVRYWAGHEVAKLAERIKDMPAATWAGIGIKARAIVACSRIGDRENYGALLYAAPLLAADAARIAAETVET